MIHENEIDALNRTNEYLEDISEELEVFRCVSERFAKRATLLFVVLIVYQCTILGAVFVAWLRGDFP